MRIESACSTPTRASRGWTVVRRLLIVEMMLV